MPPSVEDGNGPAGGPDPIQDLSVSHPAAGVYVFHTDDDREFIRTDVVVDPVAHR